MKWDPNQYAQNARFVSDLGEPLIHLLAPQAGERILDLGCGDGVLTAKLSETGCNVLGIDASAEMIEAAREIGVDARVMDGHELTFDGEFDAVFSNAALHWLVQPERVINGVWRALRPGGRFVGEFGGHGNVSAILGELEIALVARGLTPPDPWFFPHESEYQMLLEEAGFEVVEIERFKRPTDLPGDVSGWLSTFGKRHLELVPYDDRADLLDGLVDRLRPKLVDESGVWKADYVRIRFLAIKPK